jgi:hypothetical protein
MGTQTMTETNEHGRISFGVGVESENVNMSVVVRRGAYGNGSRIGVHFSGLSDTVGDIVNMTARMTDAEALAMAQAIIAAVNGGEEDCVSFPPRD